MAIRPVTFEHKIIDSDPAGWENDVTLIADVNGNGLNDIIIAGKYGPGEGRPAADGNVVWGLTGIILRDFVQQVMGWAPPVG